MNRHPCQSWLILRASGTGDPMADDDMRAHMRLALGRLPEQHRTALTLRYLEGMDYLSIERAMGPHEWARCAACSAARWPPCARL